MAGVSRLLVGAMLAVALIGATAVSQVAAEPDISGEWTADATGDFSGVCANVFFQTTSSLRADINCDIVGQGTLEGTIDIATGRFVLDGSPGGIHLHVEGSVARDGQSMAGTWSAPEFGYSGTFTGERGKGAPPAIPTVPPPGPLSEPAMLGHGPAAHAAVYNAASFGAPVPLAEPASQLQHSDPDASDNNPRETWAWLGGLGILSVTVLGVVKRISV